MAELGLPRPPEGLTYAEAGYEVRAPGFFPGFRCQDCRFSASPEKEDGFCTKLLLTINNPRGCCIYYEAQTKDEIAFSPYPEPQDPRQVLDELERGLRKHRTALEAAMGP